MLINKCSLVNYTAEQLITHVNYSFGRAENNISNIDSRALSIHGFTGTKIRHFLNNICSLVGINYLEIGVWLGSTFCAAISNNTSTLNSAIAVDNWSSFSGNRDIFLTNVINFIPQKNDKFKFIEKDCFLLKEKDFLKLPIHVYFYDGAHEEEYQYKAFTYFNKFFANNFIAIIDDWDEKSVQEGTMKAFNKLNYNIKKMWPIFTKAHTPSGHLPDSKTWWNGIFTCVISKK
jgi:hypothetical protein